MPAALAAAHDLPQLSLGDALDLTLLVARKDPARHPRVATRWLQRFLDEHPQATIAEAALAASCLAALRKALGKNIEDWEREVTYSGLGVLLAAGLALLLFTAYLVMYNARRAREALQDGRRASGTFLLGTENPWSGEIAELAWVAPKPAGAPALPSCALYLGEANGTAVIYSAADKHTWRLPSSSLIVTTKPNQDRC